MPTTSSCHVAWRKLRDGGESAVRIVKLMMACTDISLAVDAVSVWERDLPRLKAGRQKSAGMYFIRLQLAHLNEGLKVIKEIAGDESLNRVLDECDKKTRADFKILIDLAPGGSRNKEFEGFVGRVRNNVTSHYDGKLIRNALLRKGGLADGKGATVTRGSEMQLWHFKVADDILDDIVVHQIWGIPRNADTRSEADKVAGRVHEMACAFINFSGELIWRYCYG